MSRRRKMIMRGSAVWKQDKREDRPTHRDAGTLKLLADRAPMNAQAPALGIHAAEA
jgi:hypothetical protein